MVWYLYLLTYKGNPFYVGITHDLINRYRSHCRINYVLSIMEPGFFPAITILNHFNNEKEAKGAEVALIRYFASINNKLCNSDHNPLQNRISGKAKYYDLELIAKGEKLNKRYAIKVVNDSKLEYNNTLKSYQLKPT